MDEYLVNNTSSGFYYKIPDQKLVSKIRLTELTEKKYHSSNITDEVVDDYIKCESYKNNNLNLLEITWAPQDIINSHLQNKLEAKINIDFTVQVLSGVYPSLVKQEDHSFIVSLNPFVGENIRIELTRLNTWNGGHLSIGTYKPTDNNIKFTTDGMITSLHKVYKDFIIKTNESTKYLINTFKEDVTDIQGDILYFNIYDDVYFYSENKSILYYLKRDLYAYGNKKELQILKSTSKSGRFHVDWKEYVTVPADHEKISSNMMWEIIYNKHKDFFNLIENYETT